MDSANGHVQFIWGIAELLRGDYRRSEYGRVVLPFTVLRRLDLVLAPTKQAMFRRITVERPLRLRYEVSEAAIDRLRASKAFEGLVRAPANAKDPKEIERGEAAQRMIVDGLRALNGFATTERSDAEVKVRDVLCAAEKPTASLRKAVWEALSVRDPEAPVVTNGQGEPQADPELRDYENVPLGVQLEDYMEQEVLPFVEEAWVDASDERIGTEIPFTGLFHRYEAPRPLAEIDAEIRELEQRVHSLTREVTA